MERNHVAVALHLSFFISVHCLERDDNYFSLKAKRICFTSLQFWMNEDVELHIIMILPAIPLSSHHSASQKKESLTVRWETQTVWARALIAAIHHFTSPNQHWDRGFVLPLFIPLFGHGQVASVNISIFPGDTVTNTIDYYWISLLILIDAFKVRPHVSGTHTQQIKQRSCATLINLLDNLFHRLISLRWVGDSFWEPQKPGWLRGKEKAAGRGDLTARHTNASRRSSATFNKVQ